jgi:predicted HTH transcriptional regulator
MIRKTQVNSLKQLQPTIELKRDIVYNAIKSLGMATNSMIAKHLDWDINRVTGRVNELVHDGKVTDNGTYKDTSTNRTVIIWKAI